MKHLGEVGTLGGPIQFLPKSELKNWSGHAGNRFHNDPVETDYEIACDVWLDDLAKQAAEGVLRYLVMFSLTTAVEILQVGEKYIVAPTLVFEDLGCSLAQFIAKNPSIERKVQKGGSFGEKMFPLVAMDAVYSGDEALQHEHLILPKLHDGDHKFAEMTLTIDDENETFWEIS